jgi:hypothetical protein
VSRRFVLITTPFEERLENGLIQCDRCRSWFHASLHCQSFSLERIADLFGRAGAKVAIAAASGVQPFRSVRLGKITRALTGYYGGFWHEHLRCPLCGNAEIQQRRARGNPLRLLLGGTDVLLGRLVRAKPHNHVVLIELEYPAPLSMSVRDAT